MVGRCTRTVSKPVLKAGGGAEAWCILIHAEASLSLSLFLTGAWAKAWCHPPYTRGSVSLCSDGDQGDGTISSELIRTLVYGGTLSSLMHIDYLYTFTLLLNVVYSSI